MLVVSDASPIIALAQIDQLELLRQVFNEVLIGPVVAREVAPSVMLPPWIVVRSPAANPERAAAVASLDEGEAEAIQLALEVRADAVLVDERAGRQAAERASLRVIGTLRVLVSAKERGLVAAVRPLVERLLRLRFHASPELVEAVLQAAGE